MLEVCTPSSNPISSKYDFCRIVRGLLLSQVSHDGHAKPLTIGVSVHKEAKMSELLEAVRQHPAAACSPEEELILAYSTRNKNACMKATLVPSMSSKTQEYQAKHGCGSISQLQPIEHNQHLAIPCTITKHDLPSTSYEACGSLSSQLGFLPTIGAN